MSGGQGAATICKISVVVVVDVSSPNPYAGRFSTTTTARRTLLQFRSLDQWCARAMDQALSRARPANLARAIPGKREGKGKGKGKSRARVESKNNRPDATIIACEFVNPILRAETGTGIPRRRLNPPVMSISPARRQAAVHAGHALHDLTWRDLA